MWYGRDEKVTIRGGRTERVCPRMSGRTAYDSEETKGFMSSTFGPVFCGTFGSRVATCWCAECAQRGRCPIRGNVAVVVE